MSTGTFRHKDFKDTFAKVINETKFFIRFAIMREHYGRRDADEVTEGGRTSLRDGMIWRDVETAGSSAASGRIVSHHEADPEPEPPMSSTDYLVLGLIAIVGAALIYTWTVMVFP